MTGFETLDELLGQVDAVMICSTRCTQSIHWLQRKPEAYLCEKPLATNLDDAWEMVKRLPRAGSSFADGLSDPFSTPVVRAREVIESGAIGKVVAINGTNHGRMPPGWFLDPELSGAEPCSIIPCMSPILCVGI